MAGQDGFQEGGRAHLRIDALKETVRFKGHRATIVPKFKRGEREEHGRLLLEQLATALAAADADKRALGVELHLGKPGVYVAVERPVKLPEEKLQKKRAQVLMGAVTPVLRRDGRDNFELAAYFIPDDQREELAKQIKAYRDSEGANKPNAVHQRFDEVESIQFDGLRTLWTSPKPLPLEDRSAWFELWLRRRETKGAPDAEAWVEKRAEALGLQISNDQLTFPEIVVRFVHATGRALRRLVGELGGRLVEVRPACIDASVFTTVRHGDGDTINPADWVASALERLGAVPADGPCVALHDTGVARAHPLLSPLIAPDGMHARNAAWQTDDHDGHGTHMAGIAAYGDLQFPLQSAGPITPTHRLESYKILPPRGGNPPNSYGLVVHDAVSDLEIANPTAERVHCCTVTTQASPKGHPSTWSSAIDQVTSGVPNSDALERGPKRLWVQSVGNILPHEWQLNEDHFEHPIEDPAQAWNGIAVGGFTERSRATEPPFDTYPTVADVGDRSPYSRTSFAWARSLTPHKPEVVFEAGNWVEDPRGEYLCGFDSLSMLTTGRDVLGKPLECTDMTSPAAAQAARFAAMVMAARPGMWPETVRALMIHSAEWTSVMKQKLDAAGGMEARAALLRQFGYGVPKLTRALTSASNDLAIIAESEIQPFRQFSRRDIKTGKSTKVIGLNEAHYYELPWPQEILNDYYEHQIAITVTLSWFIEPNPGALGSRYPKVYRSYGLKLDLQRAGELFDHFKARINASEPQEDEEAPKDTNWMFGNRHSRAGSLFSDIWTGTVAELLGRRHICVYPVEGWWKNRTRDKRYNDRGRYCLIVSLAAPTLPVDIYTGLMQSIQTAIAAKVPIEAGDA